MDTDTIAAIATGMTDVGIGIVRISGSESLSIADRVFRSKSGERLSHSESHKAHYGMVYDGEQPIDEVIALVFRAPNSYTREDTVEIDCHGGAYVTRKVLETVVRHGARPADPGEFTKRAFLNGRIDLSQAESVMDLIQAKNDFALESSLGQLKGSILHKIKSLRGKIMQEIAFIEAALDDPEHIRFDGYGEQLLETIGEVLSEVEKLIRSFQDGRLLKEGIRTVIVGKPNVGKSSLLNALLGRERAIVTDVPGTTRDALEEQITLDGIALQIIDTAGVRETNDLVEQIGVGKTKDYMASSDLILYVVDASVPLEKNDFEIMDLIGEKKAIVLLNKSDLDLAVTEQEVRERMGEDVFVLPFSAKRAMEDGTGLEMLASAIKELFFRSEIKWNDEIFITNVRQQTSLLRAKESLERVVGSIEAGMPEDFYSIDLMDAYGELGNIIGESVGDDLIDEIFSKFCVGK